MLLLFCLLFFFLLETKKKKFVLQKKIIVLLLGGRHCDRKILRGTIPGKRRCDREMRRLWALRGSRREERAVPGWDDIHQRCFLDNCYAALRCFPGSCYAVLRCCLGSVQRCPGNHRRYPGGGCDRRSCGSWGIRRRRLRGVPRAGGRYLVRGIHHVDHSILHQKRYMVNITRF